MSRMRHDFVYILREFPEHADILPEHWLLLIAEVPLATRELFYTREYPTGDTLTSTTLVL